MSCLWQVVGASSAYVRVELAAWEDPSARVAEDGSLHAATSTYHPSLEYAPTRQLLCNIRALLFKLRQTVLVSSPGGLCVQQQQIALTACSRAASALGVMLVCSVSEDLARMCLSVHWP